MRTETARLPLFDGATFDAAQDGVRLARQSLRVFRLMADESWRTLAEIEAATGCPQASVSARLRDFRKADHGGHTVDRRRVADGRGQWEYRLRLRR